MKRSGSCVNRGRRIVCALAALGLVSGVGLLGGMHRSQAAPPADAAKVAAAVSALRSMVSQRQYEKARKLGYVLIWRDLDLHEAMWLLGRALEGLNQKDEAATIYALLLRTLENKPDPGRYKPRAEAKLKVLDVAYRRQTAAFIAGAADRKFDTPQTVDDGWMFTARCDLFTPYCLGCWTLVGTRGGVPADWIHNRDGRLHRSGAKFVTAYEGRKGLLYTQSIKDKPHPEKFKSDGFHVDNLARLGGHPPQLILANSGGAPFLRIGTKAEQRDFELRVYVDGKRIFQQRINASKWWDLKVKLPKAAAPTSRPAAPGGSAADPNKPALQKVILELACPEDQEYSGCVWIDYADFFVN